MRRRYFLYCCYPFLLAFTLLTGCQEPQRPSPSLNTGLSIEDFAATIEQISEPSGYFDSDNYISNETAYLHVVPKLRDLGIQGGVYIGVGPDQNFTYIAGIRPKYAFILDIRRGNLLEHLLFKALLEMSETPQAYLSLLFSKPLGRHPPLPPYPTMQEMVSYFDRIPGDEAIYQINLARIKQLVINYGLSLTGEDLEFIEQAYRVFFSQHLDQRWEWRAPRRQGFYFPTYRQFLLAKDLNGEEGNFLSSTDDFDYIKQMQANNLIIPVVGDFAGKQALNGIAEYIKARGDVVSAFYLSNVEYYLVPDGAMEDFARNIRNLPINERSVLIRAFVNMRYAAHPATVGNHMMTTVMQHISSFNRLYKAGRYRTYWDVGTADYIR